jgi:hypothetical protein
VLCGHRNSHEQSRGQFEPALKEVTGLTRERLETEWRASLRRGPGWVPYLDMNLLMWAVMVLLLLAAVIRFRIARRRRDEEEEEAPEGEA